MGKTAIRRAMRYVSGRRGWILVLIPAMTLAAVAAGLPVWALALLIAVQAALVMLALPAGSLTGHLRTAGNALLRDRNAVEALLAHHAAPGSGRAGAVSGAALVIRIDPDPKVRPQRDEASGAVHAAMLAALGDRLGEALRDQDQFCLIGEDGFGVALHANRGLNLGGVLAVAQRIQARLSAPLTLDGVSHWPSVSIGFCLSPRAAALNGLTMLQAAETAAEKALRGGPGGLTSYSVVDFPATLTGDRLAALRRALDNGEIHAHFQPQIRTGTGEVSGLEALARWQHPQSGLVSPADFLPQIESAGLSPRLAERMLRDALVLMRSLDDQGLRVPKVSINLSAEELRNPRLADEIGWELDRHDLAPERLTLEILETVIAQGEDDIAVRNVARLARMGCGIDLDDFGTGHASIANIRRFAVSRLKIDRSFVSHLHEDAEQQRMVAAILSMAANLGLDTVAEGVELAAEQVKLAQMGCGHLQGYAIGRPMPGADLPGWLRAHAAALEQGEPRLEDMTQARSSSRGE